MFEQLFGRTPVLPTAEFRRVANLPRRVWSPEELETLANRMTEALRRPGGQMRLRPLQALALHDAAIYGGLFGPMAVGAGKTLVFLLLPTLLESKRPLGLLPAALIQKTEKERVHLAEHWKLPTNLRLFSYDMLGRDQASQMLERYTPDAIICDEVHRLKNKKAAVTRRVHRYMKSRDTTKFVGLSGTIMKRSLHDFAHILRWCLKTGAPVPLIDGELEEWADALDEKVGNGQRRQPGALVDLATEEEQQSFEPLEAARKGFGRRLRETPGVVATLDDAAEVTCSLYVKSLEYEASPATESNFRQLRTLWMTPDGWALSEAVDLWRHSRELALGFHYIWDPRPPADWLERRREWAAFVRNTLSRSRSLDTELQVSNACSRGDLPDLEFKSWQEIKDTFIPNQVAVWHDDAALLECEKWISQGPGVIWCDHVFFARELAKRTGVTYFGARGLSDKGERVEEADARKAIIVSTAANSTGRNLQAWSRNLITAAPMSALGWEQMLGRTHRPGQLADQVEFDVLAGCREHVEGFYRALAEAKSTKDITSNSQKLLLADVSFLTLEQINTRRSPRWDYNK